MMPLQVKLRVFCNVCIKFSTTRAGRKRDKDFSWFSGIIFSSAAGEKRSKSRHLSSVSHTTALKHIANDDEEQVCRGFPNSTEQSLCTENALTAAMFMVNHNLAHRIDPNLCALISLIIPQNSLHPLGNRHQGHTAVKKMLSANSETVENKLKEDYSTELSATKFVPQVTVAADKGTAPKDVTRQVIVATTKGENGMPQEKLLGAPPIMKRDSASTAANLTKTIKKFMNPKQVAYIATDTLPIMWGKILE